MAAGLVARRGGGPWRATPVHAAAGLAAAVLLMTGVLTAPGDVAIGEPLLRWVALVEPFAVFVVALACLRAAGGAGRWTLSALAGVTAAAVLLGVVEHVSGHAWGALVAQLGGLERRGDSTRVRGGEEFALGFAWVLAALVPAVLMRLRRQPVLAALALAACLLAAYWTYTRSAPGAFLLGLVVLVAVARDLRVTAVALAGVIVVGALLAIDPGLAHRFSVGVDPGALAVRGERLPVVLQAAAHRPLQGLGLTGVTRLGIEEIDNSYVLAYATTGVIGLVSLLVTLLVGIGYTARAAGRRGSDVVGPALAGALVLVVAGGLFDVFAVRGTADLLWLLLAVGAAGAENVRGRVVPMRIWSDSDRLRGTVVLVAAALAGGTAVALSAPPRVALSTPFETIPAARLTATYDPVSTGTTLVNTTCGIARAYGARHSEVRVTCRDLHAGAGIGVIRVQSSTTERDVAAVGAIAAQVRTSTRVSAIRLDPALPVERGRPTLAATAPVSAGLLVLLLCLLVPRQRREPGPGGRDRRVDRGDGLPDLPREQLPAGDIAEQGSEHRPEAVLVGSHDA